MENFQFSHSSDAYFGCLRQLKNISDVVGQAHIDRCGDNEYTLADLEEFELKMEGVRDCLFKFLKLSVINDIETEAG